MQPILDFCRQQAPRPSMTIFSNQHLISMNLYQHAKNQTFSLFCSTDIIDLKSLQSDWPNKTFWHTSQETRFSKILPSVQQLIYTSIIYRTEKKINN